MIPNKSFINNLITFILIPYFIIENEIKRRTYVCQVSGLFSSQNNFGFNISHASMAQ